MERRNVRNGGTTLRKLFPPTFLTFLSGCSPSPEKALQKTQQQLRSWNSTESLTRELDQRGALPRVYVRQVDEAVEQGREKAQQQTKKSR